MSALATSVDESELLSQLRTGSESAFAQLVAENAGRLLGIARSMLRSEEDAADAVQVTFVQAFRGLPTFAGNASLRTWLHRIVVNSCLMKRRSQSRQVTYSLEDLLPQFDESGHHAEPVCPWSERGLENLLRRESRQELRECLDRLPESYREIIELRDLQEFDTEEVASLLNIAPGTVKTRLHRARQALRTLLEPLVK